MGYRYWLFDKAVGLSIRPKSDTANLGTPISRQIAPKIEPTKNGNYGENKTGAFNEKVTYYRNTYHSSIPVS